MDIPQEYEALLEKYRISYGSVRGLLLPAAGKGDRNYKVIHHITGKEVECIIPEWLAEQASAAQERRVTLSGIVHRSKKWETLRMEVREIRVMPEAHELPSLDELRGSMKGMTGGLATEEFLRIMRSEGYDDYPEPDYD